MPLDENLLRLLSCPTSTNGRACRGPLAATEASLACGRCGREFAIVSGVPVLHPEGNSLRASDWYETMYCGRSRTAELASDYLRAEREFIAGFSKDHSVKGPCLEIGCGVGLFAEVVRAFVGLEYSLEGLLVPGFESFNRVSGDATSLPFEDGSFELIFSFNTLEHIAGVEAVFEEIERVCAPGGFIVLRPAWHCARYVTELVPVLPYHDLSIRQKIVKLFLPILKCRAWKFTTRVPSRLRRRMTAGATPRLSFKKLTPYHGPKWISDADAEVSLDSHEGILYFVRRGYRCLSHRSVSAQVLAGHDTIVLQKPRE